MTVSGVQMASRQSDFLMRSLTTLGTRPSELTISFAKSTTADAVAARLAYNKQ
jgi:hypothetical protein